jgi:hypothetical protein
MLLSLECNDAVVSHLNIFLTSRIMDGLVNFNRKQGFGSAFGWYSENDYLLRYYGCLRETSLVAINRWLAPAFLTAYASVATGLYFVPYLKSQPVLNWLDSDSNRICLS